MSLQLASHSTLHVLELLIYIKVACVQNYLKPHVNKNLKFLVSDPNGMDHVQWVSIYYFFFSHVCEKGPKLTYC